MRSDRKGFSLVEIAIVCFLVVVVLGVALKVMSGSARAATHSENRILASLLAESVVEEIAVHPYGERAPNNWTTDFSTVKPAAMWLEGRPHQSEFHVKVVYKNGSFVGQTVGNNDVVTVVISWKDGNGENPGYGALSEEFYTAPGGARDNHHLLVSYPVWR